MNEQMENKISLLLGHYLSTDVKIEGGCKIREKKYKTWLEEFVVPSTGTEIKKVTCPECNNVIDVTVNSKEYLRKGRVSGCYVFSIISILCFISAKFIGFPGILCGVCFIICVGMNYNQMKKGNYTPIEHTWFVFDGVHKKMET